MKKNSKADLINEQIKQEELNRYPGYPLYPASDDIYNKFQKDENVDMEAAIEMQNSMNKAKVHTRNERDFGLDVPGSELDNQQEDIGSEDEENNYYSIGGDNHNDLEEAHGE